jgi:ubiquinone/menaquinone biosynthesis C-methylase UbiE
MQIRKFYYSLNPTLRLLARRILYFPFDLLVSMSRKRPKLVPPTGLIFTGAGDFKAIGDKLFKKIKEECDLTPDARVLDVGCGIGRLARPFSAYLNDSGVYHGFDVVSTGIKWCKKHYRNFKNFHFHHVSVKNDLYNLNADKNAVDFSFPFESNHFDAVIVISVFTHMQENDVKRYLSEISRVIQNGKYCFCTFFLVTPEREQNIQSRHGGLSFDYKFENYYLHDYRIPDANVAFKFDALKKMLHDTGLTIVKHLPGWWFDEQTRANSFDFQDVLVLRKRLM